MMPDVFASRGSSPQLVHSNQPLLKTRPTAAAQQALPQVPRELGGTCRSGGSEFGDYLG